MPTDDGWSIDDYFVVIAVLFRILQVCILLIVTNSYNVCISAAKLLKIILKIELIVTMFSFLDVQYAPWQKEVWSSMYLFPQKIRL